VAASPSPFANLSPRQKRIAAVAGAGGLVALVVILGRRSAPAPAPVAAEEVDPYADEAVVPLGDPPFEPYSTFADNSEAAAMLGTAVTDGLGEVSGALFGQQQGFEAWAAALQAQQDAAREDFRALTEEGLPALGAGISGEIGNLPGQIADALKPKKGKPPKKAPNGFRWVWTGTAWQLIPKKGGNGKPNKPGGGGGKPGGGNKPGKDRKAPAPTLTPGVARPLSPSSGAAAMASRSPGTLRRPVGPARPGRPLHGSVAASRPIKKPRR
jgi:hypothetical protein